MTAIYKTLVFEPGATFARTFQCVQTKVAGRPLADLTGYTCQTQIRTAPGGELLAQVPSFVDASNATFGFSLPAEDTVGLTFTRASLDCLLIAPDGTFVARTIRADLTGSPAVTVQT